jgi:methylmalonyl-CoA mutase N-terminal domain/subunit
MHEEIHKTDILQIDETVRDHQLERLQRVKSTRDNASVSTALDRLKLAARDNENTMPFIIDAVKAYASVEEISVALRDVYGVYEEPAF